MTQTSNVTAASAVTLNGLPFCASFGRVIMPASSKDVIPTKAREECLMHLHSVLVSPERNNAILTGRPGVGKTTLLRELAALIAEKSAGEPLAGSLIVELDMNKLKGSASMHGNMEKNVAALWNEAGRSGGVIFFIDEAHRLAAGGADSIGNMLKPLVTSGKVPVVLATTTDEYRVYIERDGALKRRFEEVRVPEPDRPSMLRILKGKAESFGEKLKVSAGAEALEAVLNASEKYMGEMAEPDRSLKLLERACTLASLSEEDRSVNSDDVLRAAGLLKNMRLKAVKLPATREEAADMLAGLVTGQEEAAAKAAEFLVCDGAGFHLGKEPRGLFLFSGPSGCGKRTMAEATAELLGVRPSDMVRITLSPSVTAAHLAGVSPEFPGLLTEPVRKNPRSVILVDGLEVAHPDGAGLLAQIAAKGLLKNWSGAEVNFAGTVIFLCLDCPDGRAGVGRNIGFAPAPSKEKDAPADSAPLIKQHLPHELRFMAAEAVLFSALDREGLRQIFLRKHEKALLNFAAVKGFALSLSEDALEALLDRAEALGGNGASLERAVKELRPILAEAVNCALPGEEIRILGRDGVFIAVCGDRTPGEEKKPDLAA